MSNLLIFEDVGDIGNEYVFKQPSEDQTILSTQFPFEVIVAEDNGLEAKIILKNKMLIPESANKLLKEEQEKIVRILDRFDQLCTDISEGLPAEIEARQKQYEYYRDKLLTFKELKVNE